VAGASSAEDEWAVCDRIAAAYPDPPAGAVVGEDEFGQ